MAVPVPLDDVFQALAHAVRRAVVERLGRGPATVTELAKPFDMAMPSFLQHLRVLERSGLVRSAKQGRVRTVHVRPERLKPVAGWLRAQEQLWERRLDQLDEHLKGMEQNP